MRVDVGASGIDTVHPKQRIDMTKDNFIFYRQWWESIRELEPDEQRQAYDSIMRFVFEGIEPTDKYIRAVTSLMRSTIKRDLEKYERVCERNRANGKNGGRPRKTKTEKTDTNPNNPMGFENNPVQTVESEPDIADIITDAPPIELTPVAVITPESRTDLEQQFDAFRKSYPGTKRGFKAEFDNFKRKYPKTWREIIPLLAPALERLIDWHERSIAAGQFTPNYKNLATWLNQQCWTEELPEIIVTPITPRNNGTTAINHSNIDRQSEFARHIIDKLTTPDRPEPDISGNY